MGSKFPIYDELAKEAGSNSFEDVLALIFTRERQATRADEKASENRRVEMQARVERRDAIIKELGQFGNRLVLKEPLERLKVAQQEDMEDIDLLVSMRRASGRRSLENIRMLKKIMKVD